MSLPTSIRKRDGRLVPFESERISRSLFTVTEMMGAPDAFLARELTDGILHFINLEPNDALPTTNHLADMVVKVVRELGYPAIARIYEECIRTAARRPAIVPREPTEDSLGSSLIAPADPLTAVHRAAREQLREFSLSRVYPRDIVSAHRNGLLRLLDLDHPHEAAGMALAPLLGDRWELLEAIVAGRAVVGSFIAIDSPEFALAGSDGSPADLVDSFLNSLDRSLGLTGLHAILNLNIADAPAWTPLANPGPLFQNLREDVGRERMDAIADVLLQKATREAVFWHLSERDFQDGARSRLRATAARALAPPKVEFERAGINSGTFEFVFDRARQPIMLGPGIDREARTALGFVGMNLLQLAEQIGGDTIDQALFVRKVGSLARLAKSAGHARQAFLRKNGRPELQRGFLLERAVEIVVPQEILEAARRVLGMPADAHRVLELARQCLTAIRMACESDHSRAMTTRIDCFTWHELEYYAECLTDNKSSFKQQLRAGSKLLKACGGRGLTIQLKQPLGVDEMLELLEMAHRSTDIDRLCFGHTRASA